MTLTTYYCALMAGVVEIVGEGSRRVVEGEVRTLRMNLGAPPDARCGLESDSASKMVTWSVPWSKI